MQEIIEIKAGNGEECLQAPQSSFSNRYQPCLSSNHCLATLNLCPMLCPPNLRAGKLSILNNCIRSTAAHISQRFSMYLANLLDKQQPSLPPSPIAAVIGISSEQRARELLPRVCKCFGKCLHTAQAQRAALPQILSSVPGRSAFAVGVCIERVAGPCSNPSWSLQGIKSMSKA